ncbi:MAG: hypothetical protein ABIQ86_00910 [Steroidobacteraceae bacterium]
MFLQRHALRTNAVLAAIFAVSATGFSSSSQAAENCDRACLTGLITTYVDAMVAHDPSKLPIVDNAKITENSKAIKLADGLWKTATAKGQFRQDYVDLKKQVAAAHLVIIEGQAQALYSLVLHVTDGKISGIEALVQRVTAESRFKPTELTNPIKGMNDPVPAGKKQSRESMIRTALTYPEGLRVGSFTDGGTPFAPDTYRVENGTVTAGGNCGRTDCGMYAQNILVHPSIIASVAAVDEENGTVLLWMNFGHTGSSYGEGNSLVTFEAFKVWGGQIHAINAFFLGLPISTARFWPSSDPIPK